MSRNDVLVSADWAQEHLGDPGFVFVEVVAAIGQKNLVDVRSPDEFSGKLVAPAHLPQEGAQRPGHIPTALNVPWSKAANEDGTFKSDEELAQLYEGAGLDTGKETI